MFTDTSTKCVRRRRVSSSHVTSAAAGRRQRPGDRRCARRRQAQRALSAMRRLADTANVSSAERRDGHSFARATVDLARAPRRRLAQRASSSLSSGLTASCDARAADVSHQDAIDRRTVRQVAGAPARLCLGVARRRVGIAPTSASTRLTPRDRRRSRRRRRSTRRGACTGAASTSRCFTVVCSTTPRSSSVRSSTSRCRR